MATVVHLTSARKTPIGPLLIAATRSGVVRIHLGDDDDAVRRDLARQFLAVDVRRGSTLTTETARVLRSYLAGGPDPVHLPHVLPEDGFAPRVWAALKRIPRGQVRSYGAIARTLRRRGAARAVGQACGRNPLPLIVPCHRVVAADRRLGGFTGGLDIKRHLLELEGALPVA